MSEGEKEVTNQDITLYDDDNAQIFNITLEVEKEPETKTKTPLSQKSNNNEENEDVEI